LNDRLVHEVQSSHGGVHDGLSVTFKTTQYVTITFLHLKVALHVQTDWQPDTCEFRQDGGLNIDLSCVMYNAT
jgi:hypothetical protein